MTQGGFGLTCQIDVGGSLAAFAKIMNMDLPSFSKFLAESTTHDSAQGYYEATATGKRRVQPFNVELAWDVNQASHAAILTAFNSDDPVTFTVADPDGDETISIEVHAETVNRAFVQEDIGKATVALHPTGPATIT